MRARLQRRLGALQDEYAAGQKMMRELEQRRQELETTMLRIAGAIQVLEEELGDGRDDPSDDLPDA